MSASIEVEITDPHEFHCFRLVLNPLAPPEPYCATHGKDLCDGTGPSCVVMPPRIEIMLHARTLVELIYRCSTALCEWQRATTTHLICERTGLSEEEARAAGLIA